MDVEAAIQFVRTAEPEDLDVLRDAVSAETVERIAARSGNSPTTPGEFAREGYTGAVTPDDAGKISRRGQQDLFTIGKP